MTQPHGPEQGIISLLIQEQLSIVSQTRVDFAVFVDVGSYHPRAGFVVQVEDAAFADVDEEADVLLTSGKQVSVEDKGSGEERRTYHDVAAHPQSAPCFHSAA